MTRARVPFIVVVATLLVGAFLVERNHDRDTLPEPELDLSRAAPLSAPSDVLGSTWYCAAGSAVDDGPADHTVVLANPTAGDRVAELTAFPGTAAPVTFEATIPAFSIERVRVRDIVTAPAAAVMVEAPGGSIAVTHELIGPTGRDSGPCSSTSSDVWHFAWGDTSRDARSLIVLFNPFPGDAVVDFRFATIDGTRLPQRLTGVVVPGQSVIVTDIGAEITRRDQVSTTLVARSGRVIAERLQTFDDTEEMLEGSDSRRALTVDLGSPVPLETWVHPSARFTEGLIERIVVYNPGTATAEVDVEVLMADPSRGAIEPFELSVRPGSYESITLSDEARVIELLDDGGFDATLIVRSLNDVGVVAERVTLVPTTAEAPGMSASAGTPLVGRSLVVVDPRPSGADAAVLTVMNLDSAALVTGSVTVLSRGVERPLGGYESFEIGPGGRVAIDLVDQISGSGTSVLVVESSGPVAVTVVARSSGPSDRFEIPAILQAGDAVLPPGFLATG
jgi:hypothetical protein